MTFVQLPDLQVRVHFCVVVNLFVPLLMVTSFMDRFIKGVFLMRQHIVFIWSRSFAIIWEYTTSLDPLAVLQNDSETGSDTEDGQDNKTRKPLFRVPRARHNTAEYRSACIRYDQQRWTLLHGARPQFDVKPNGPASLKDCKCPTTRTHDNTRRQLFEEADTLSKGILIGGGTDLSAVTLHLDQGSSITLKRGKRRISLSHTMLKP